MIPNAASSSPEYMSAVALKLSERSKSSYTDSFTICHWLLVAFQKKPPISGYVAHQSVVCSKRLLMTEFWLLVTDNVYDDKPERNSSLKTFAEPSDTLSVMTNDLVGRTLDTIASTGVAGDSPLRNGLVDVSTGRNCTETSVPALKVSLGTAILLVPSGVTIGTP